MCTIVLLLYFQHMASSDYECSLYWEKLPEESDRIPYKWDPLNGGLPRFSPDFQEKLGKTRAGIVRDIKAFIKNYNYPQLKKDLRDYKKNWQTLEAIVTYYRWLNEIIVCYERLLREYSRLTYIQLQNERIRWFESEILDLRNALNGGGFRKYAISWFEYEMERGTFKEVLQPAQAKTDEVRMRANHLMVYSLGA